MKENEFLHELEKRAEQQEALVKVMKTSPAQNFIISQIANHPWRVLVPFAILLTIFLRILFGHTYFEFILYIFAKH